MTGARSLDTTDAIAAVAIGSWDRLLRIHHRRLRRADLEDCLSQATLELLTAAARGQHFADGDAIRAALDKRFQSRIIDRQRAFGGRSPISASLHYATPLHTVIDAIGNSGADPLARVLEREQLAQLTSAIRELTPDQRLVLRSQLNGQEGPTQFCERYGWSIEKYRKTAQRARAKLRRLVG